MYVKLKSYLFLVFIVSLQKMGFMLLKIPNKVKTKTKTKTKTKEKVFKLNREEKELEEEEYCLEKAAAGCSSVPP